MVTWKTNLLLMFHIGQVERMLAKLIMEDKVEELCAKPYERDTQHEGRNKRWGSHPGSIQIRGRNACASGCRAYGMLRRARSILLKATAR